MCCTRSLNNKTNRLHEQCLRIVFSDKKKQILKNCSKRDGFVCIYHQNIRFLAIEIIKVLEGIDPQIVKETLQFSDAGLYQLRKQTDLQIPSVPSVSSDTEGIKFRGGSRAAATSKMECSFTPSWMLQQS